MRTSIQLPILLAAFGAALPAFAAQTSDDAKIFSKYFKLEVKGLYGEVPGCTSCDPGRLTITIEEATQGDKPEYRTYTYGSHEYEDMTFTVQTGPGMTKLQGWADKAMKMGGAGTALGSDISVYVKSTNPKTAPVEAKGCKVSKKLLSPTRLAVSLRCQKFKPATTQAPRSGFALVLRPFTR